MEPWVEPGDVPDKDRFQTVDMDEVCAAASEILYSLSGWQYGVGRVRIRPARIDPQCECGIRDSVPIGLGSTGPVIAGIGRGVQCTCSSDNTIRLRGRNPRDLIVRLDGAVLTTSQYRLMRNRLIRVGGVWPCCQRMDLDDTEPGTFSCLYTWGTDPPASGRLAAKALSAQLGLAALDSNECRLPSGVREIARTGVTAVVSDPTVLLENGQTGIEVVDMFLAAANGPGGRKRPSRVYSPDVPNSFTEALP